MIAPLNAEKILHKLASKSPEAARGSVAAAVREIVAALNETVDELNSELYGDSGNDAVADIEEDLDSEDDDPTSEFAVVGSAYDGTAEEIEAALGEGSE